MDKAVNIRIEARVEGEDKPAHDFAAEGVALVTKAMALGLAALDEQRRRAGLPSRQITVKAVTALEGGFEDDDV